MFICMVEVVWASEVYFHNYSFQIVLSLLALFHIYSCTKQKNIDLPYILRILLTVYSTEVFLYMTLSCV